MQFPKISEDVEQIKISDAWIRFIKYCQQRLPYGDIKVRIVNGEPTDLLEEKEKIRFDRETTIPKGNHI